MTLKKTANKLLTNKYVLYTILFLAITNILGYLSVQDFKSLTIFIVVGVLTQYFSKNMAVVLLTTMFATNLIMIMERKSKIMEGLKNMKEGMKSKREGMKKREPMTNDETDDEDDDNKLDYTGTMKEAYQQMNDMIGSEGMKNLTKETMGLMKQQEALVANMEKMTPMLEGAQNMLENFDTGKIEGLINKIGGMGGMESMKGGIMEKFTVKKNKKSKK